MVEPCNVSRNVAFGTEKFDELDSLMQATDEANLEAAFRLLTSQPLPQANNPIPLAQLDLAPTTTKLLGRYGRGTLENFLV